jgi:hypothetical protein
MTGCHSILVDELTEKQRDQTIAERNGEQNAELYSGDVPKDLSVFTNDYRDINQNCSIPPTKTNTTRVLNTDMSVRTGKYGPYVYYKTAKMKTPTFFNIKKYKENCWECNPDTLIEWVKSTYKVI